MTNNEEMLFMAREYAAKGWAMIVLWGVNDDLSCACGNSSCPDTGKHPVGGRGVKDATKDLSVLESLLVEEPTKEPNPMRQRRNLGIVAGEVSNLTILDIDMGPGKLGAQTWVELIREHGEPQTLRAITGSGGMHLFFTYNSALKTSSNTLGKHVDCRNDNGYVVAPPSRHKSGNLYRWDNWGGTLVALPGHLARRKETRGRPRKDDLYRGKYTIEQVRGMLEVVPADDRDLWRNVGIILGREFKRADAAWQLYNDWAATWGGTKGRGHDANMHACFYEKSQEQSDSELSLGTIIKAAMEHGWAPKRGEVPKEAFIYYGPGNNFIYRSTHTEWIAAGVDVVCSPVNEEGKIMRASEWIKIHTHATSLTSDPAIEEDYVKGINVRDGQVIHELGSAVFNTYRRPTLEPGDARLAGPFLEHCQRLFNQPGDSDQFLNYMAHRAQKPWEKPRFALLLAGGQGIGKDTMIEFCCPAFGEWNVANIEPAAFETNYNDYVAATLIRINEASNLHEMSKWAFNERTKVLIAGTPDTVRVNPKYGHQYTVRMYCGVVITTNNLATGLYIPPDDRRYDVIDCATLEDMGLGDATVRGPYFDNLWEWFHAGGNAHILAFLLDRDLSHWSHNRGQRKTAAHREVIQSNARQDDWLDDILDAMNYPDYVRADWVTDRAEGKGEKKGDVVRKLSPTMGRMGYTRYVNPGTKDGRWRVNGTKFVLYIREGVVPEENFLDKLILPGENPNSTAH